ncbi:MAG: amino acid adenylation domain-containing protein, partial [Acidobacteriota bacterium]
MGFENVEDLYPLTPTQEGLLYHAASDGDDVYHDQILATVDPGDGVELDVDAFKAAWVEVTRRQAALRTGFLWDGLDESLQVVRTEVEIDFQVTDAALSGAAFDRLAAEDRRRGFELDDAPLFRLHLARLDDRRWRLLLSFHHLILDGWSARRVLNEVRTLVAGRGASLEPPFPFSSFVAWLGERDLDADQAFWRRRLAGFETPTRLDLTAPVDGTGPGQRERLFIDAEATSDLRRVVRRHGLTEATVIQGAWLRVLSAYSRESDVVTGLTVSGRPAELPGVFGGVGLFINTLPLRAAVTEAPAVEWMRDLQRAQFATQPHHWAPLASIQKTSELAVGEALFDHLLVIENHPDGDGDDGGLRFRDLDFRERSHYPFALLAVPGGRLELQAIYDGSRFGRAGVARALRQLSAVLQDFASDPERPASALRLDTPEERRRRRGQATGTDLPFPRDATVHRLIADAAERDPSAPAVLTADGQLTYGELLGRSRELAAVLRGRGARPSEPVALLIERSIDMVVGLVAILEAGAAYVPLDPEYPAPHLRRVLDDAGARILLTRRRYGGILEAGEGSVDTVIIDEPASWGDAAVPADPEPGADDLAYVIYTSGSSGAPKGVAVSHRHLVASTWARRETYGDDAAPRRFLLLSSFAFDSSVAGLFWTLTAGGALVLPRPGEERDLEALDRLAATHGASHTLCLPSLYRLLLERPATADLRVAVVAGEACSTALVAAHFEHRPGTRLFNEYGPTEATVWATAQELRPEDAAGAVPIGGPIANTRLHVLDRAGAEVATGVPGELHIAGAGVARYWRNDPGGAFIELERPDGAERVYRTGDLVAWGDDGRLLFLGRADAQVKIRGHRLETDGVEAALRRLGAVADAAVAVRPGPRGHRLCAWVVPPVGERPEPRDIQRRIAEAVPEFMVPDAVAVIDGLPRRPNGKVDYRALPDPGAAVTPAHPDTSEAPRGEVEMTIAEAWAEVLGVEKISRRHHFFELGGDSILGIQVISRLRQAELPAAHKDIAALPVLADLAAVLERRRPAGELSEGDRPDAGGELEPFVGELPLAPIQRWFFDRELPAPHHWNLPALFALDPSTPLDTTAAAVE